MKMKDIMSAQREEMLRHKWIESEKAGHDLGDSCMVKWAKDYGADWRFKFNMEHLMELPDSGEAIYFGIFLDDESRALLISNVKDVVQPDWAMKCERCTLSFGNPESSPDVKEYIAANLGKKVELKVTTIGRISEAVAVGVTGDFKSTIEHPHIPVAIPPGGHSRYSNFIKTWEPFTMDTVLHGVVDTFPRIFK